MSGKLKNVQAVRQMLDGTHKTQTKKLFNYDVKSPTRKRKVGDRWTDEKGNEWEQKEGYKIKHGKLDDLRDSLFYKNKACPKCGVPMSKRLDEKFFNIRGMCFDCNIAVEHQMKLDGTYDKYEHDLIRNNFDAWLSDTETEVELLKIAATRGIEYVNADGKIEKWSSPYTVEQIDQMFSKFKTNVTKQMDED